MTAADAELKKTILIADNRETNVCRIRDLFDETYCVLTVDNITDAINLLYRKKVYLVLAAVEMTLMNGYDLILTMKEDPLHASIPVIAMADVGGQSEKKAFDEGADDFVTLPFDNYIMQKRVERLINCFMVHSALQVSLKEAQSANYAKTAFLSRVSHDMRTPLNGIMGLTTLMQARVTNDQDKKDLKDMEMSGRYLLNLINDTLDMSRIESGQLSLHPNVCESSSLFENAFRLAKSSMQGRDIQLSISTEKFPYDMLYVDAGRIEQIILNVFGNAVKFTPDGGEIELNIKTKSVEENSMITELVIRDTGIGMSPDFIPHIFEPFVQAAGSNAGSYQGTGLGMAITKLLLQCMGGDITVESEQGKGSCFTIILKLQLATEAQIADWYETKNGPVKDVVLQGKRVLLCEDHPLNASITVRLLEAKGMTADVAENGQIGLELFMYAPAGSYDAILMDIRMPVMDGIHAAKAIRSLRRTDAQTIPIIAMTANAFYDDIQATRAAGMDAHLSKPIQADLLYHTVAQVLSDSK